MVRKFWGLLWLAAVGAWAQEGMNAKASAAGLTVGSALEIDWTTDKTLAPLLLAQFGFLSPTPALDWDGNEDWPTWVANAQALGLPFRGPRLAGGRTPARLASFDAKGLDREFVNRVQVLQSQTKSPPLSWDVAAGVFLPSGQPAPSVFRTVWGPDWPARALTVARSVDSRTPLFLAEDDTLGLNPRSDALYRLAADLKRRGVPLDGVALGARQRLSARSSGLEVGANLRRFAALGLVIHIVDWDYGLDQDQTIPDRTAVQAQSGAYLEVFRWFLATPAVKAVAMAEPSDRFTRSSGPPGVYAAPSLFASAGIAKAVVSAMTAVLRRSADVTELLAEAAKQDLVPLERGADGWPSGWQAPVWHLVPVTEDALPGGEFRHRATFYRNAPDASRNATADDFGLLWYLSWSHDGLVFQAERSDDVVLPGNRGEAIRLEIRGPGFAGVRDLVVGIDAEDAGGTARWSQAGRFLRVTFAVPATSGWGPGTLFFCRFSATDSDGGRDLGLTLDPWPLNPTGASLPWKAFRLVEPYD